MKKSLIPTLAVLSAMFLFTGCLGDLKLGGGTKTVVQKPTIGQQLTDLKKAKDAGAITDSEYQAQKTKLLESN